MKLYEKINQLKGTNSSIETITNWFYNNRIYPYDVVYNNALELDKELPKDIKDILMLYDTKVIMNGVDAVREMLDLEVSNE